MRAHGLTRWSVRCILLGIGLDAGGDLVPGPHGLVRFHYTFGNAFFQEFFQARNLLGHEI